MLNRNFFFSVKEPVSESASQKVYSTPRLSQNHVDSSLTEISNQSLQHGRYSPKHTTRHPPVPENQLEGNLPRRPSIDRYSPQPSQLGTEPNKPASNELQHHSFKEPNQFLFQDFLRPDQKKFEERSSKQVDFVGSKSGFSELQDHLVPIRSLCVRKPEQLEADRRFSETQNFSPPTSSRLLPAAEAGPSHEDRRVSKEQQSKDYCSQAKVVDWVQRDIQDQKTDRYAAYRTPLEESHTGYINTAPRDSATKMADSEVEKAMHQSPDQTAPDRNKTEAKVRRPYPRTTTDDASRYASFSHPNLGTPEQKRRTSSPHGNSSLNRWRSHPSSEAKLPQELWRSRSAALVKSLDAVESGKFKHDTCTVSSEAISNTIVFSTADPYEQKLMEKISRNPLIDQEHSDHSGWCQPSSRSSGADFRGSRIICSQSDVAAESQTSERPLGFRKVTGAGTTCVSTPAGPPLVGPRPLSATFEGPLTPLLNGQILVSSSQPQPSSCSSHVDGALLNFHNQLTLMPTVEEENSEADSSVARRMVRKRSSSGSIRSPNDNKEVIEHIDCLTFYIDLW